MTNMKHKNLMARLMAGALALVLAAGIGMAPAMAAEKKPGPSNDPWDPIKPGSDLTPATNTVTVNQAVPGAEYKLYKLLQLEHKDEEYEYTPEGAETPVTAKKIVTYRYSYGDGLKDIISAVVALPQFQYAAEAGGNTAITHPGYGFKVDGENVVFITPSTDDKGDYTEDDTVRKMMVAFADELRKRIEDTAGLTAVQTQTAADAVPEGGNLTVSFDKVPNGYWMITSNAGARSIVFTSPEEADIGQVVNVDEKNPAPTVVKKVFDVDDVAGTDAATGGSWKDANDAQIGDTVDYKITVELYKGAENIIVYDNMDDGLTFKELKGVKFFPRSEEKNADGTAKFERVVYELGTEKDTDPAKGLELTENGAAGKTVKTDVGTLTVDTDKHGFALTFKNAFTNPAAGADNRDEGQPKNNVFLGDLSTLEDDGGRIEIEYSAVLNENAVVNGDHKLVCDKTEGADHTHGDACYTDSNDNESYVKYGHITGVEPGKDPETPTDPPRESNHDETKTYTYTFSIDKYVSGDSKTKLEGAKFELRKNFVGIGTAAVEKDGNKYAWVEGGNLKLPATEYKADEIIKLKDETPTTTGYDGGMVYRVATPEEITADDKLAEDAKTLTTEIVTDKTGKITIKGLDWTLTEVTQDADGNNVETAVHTGSISTTATPLIGLVDTYVMIKSVQIKGE